MTKRALGSRRTMSALADLVLPTSCGGCDLPGVSWCARCAAVFAEAPPPYRWWPTPMPVGLPPVLTILAYEGPVRAAVVNWKDNGRRDLAGVLAPPLTEGLLAALLSCAAGPRSPPRPEEAPEASAQWSTSASNSALASGLTSQVIIIPTPSGRANVRRRGDRPLRALTRQALGPVPAVHRPRVVEALQLRRSVAD